LSSRFFLLSLKQHADLSALSALTRKRLIPIQGEAASYTVDNQNLFNSREPSQFSVFFLEVHTPRENPPAPEIYPEDGDSKFLPDIGDHVSTIFT
jgi:hypothetical protein